MTRQIVHASTQPQRLPELAQWHHREWGHLYDDWTEQIALQELQSHTDPDAAVDTTWLMLRNDTLCGSVSLVREDAPALRHLTGPWLASLWIAPDLRRQGLGAMLVRHVIGHAHDHAIPMLRLFSPRNELWYRKLGWQREHAAELLGQTVIVMSCLPAQAISAEPGP